MPTSSAGSSRRHDERGHTLLELLLVVGIVAVVALVVAPRAGAGLQHAAHAAAAREVKAALEGARSRAIATQSPVRVAFDVDARSYRVLPTGSERRLPPDLRLEVVTAVQERAARARAAIRFYPDGSATGGQVRLLARGRLQVVDIDWLTGRVRLYTGS